MKRKSLKIRLKDYLSKCGCYVHKAKLEIMGQEAGYMGDTVGRALRQLKEDGEIEGKENENGSMMYRSLTPLKKQDVWRINPVTKQPELLKTIYE